MHDIYVMESRFGQRLTVRNVCAADADDAVHTHELHYPGERIASVRAPNPGGSEAAADPRS
jgi:hypothetical protein